jgi:hypothetical protein
MNRGRPDPRRVKIHRNYTVADIARRLDVHRNTVRHWLKDGLRVIEGIWPTLILGAELRRFLTEKRSRRKRPTPPGHIYCMRCREPMRPALGLVDYVPRSSANGNLEGICPTCEAMLNRCVRLSDLARVTAGLDVRITPAKERLRQTSQPSVNHDSDTPPVSHAETQP